MTPRSAGTKGWHDPDHLPYAVQHGYTILTANPADFLALHQQWQAQGQDHAGIISVAILYADVLRHDLEHLAALAAVTPATSVVPW